MKIPVDSFFTFTRHFNRAASGLTRKLKIAALEFFGKKIESVASNTKTKQLLFNCFTPTNSKATILSFLAFRGIQSKSCPVKVSTLYLDVFLENLILMTIFLK